MADEKPAEQAPPQPTAQSAPQAAPATEQKPVDPKAAAEVRRVRLSQTRQPIRAVSPKTGGNKNG